MSFSIACVMPIIGDDMIVYRQRYAKMLYNSTIVQSLLIWMTSLLMGGYSAAISLALSCLSVILMWICSLSFSTLVALILPHISSSPMALVSSTWLAVGLFAAPALLGALIGPHFGYLIFQRYLLDVSSEEGLISRCSSRFGQVGRRRWLFKVGLVQGLVLDNGLLEATLSPIHEATQDSTH
ncbi:hypothetical protein LOK49_LG06G01556 [Camellia lanceoleosa]|uniref:Uncharacterized protein n=1 Tax=Camellia lanceoleosa TaxID=1840588 RepID=A0ACC0H955_9ERIC|nr:hypothetical protein LOK49_LG06G01556 [Camellia lanceoleosa]